ncbi:S-protein homolog 74 [Linum perenne]
MFSSLNSQQKILTAPVTTIVAVIAVLLLALIPTSSAYSWPFMPTYRVHVINDLANHEVLLVHCDSSKGDRPVAYISFQTDYTWDFKLHTFGHTRWRCHVAPDRYRSRYFRVFDENQTPNAFDYNVYWVVKNEGIYFRDPSRGVDIFKYKWQPGRLSN